MPSSESCSTNPIYSHLVQQYRVGPRFRLLLRWTTVKKKTPLEGDTLLTRRGISRVAISMEFDEFKMVRGELQDP